MEIGLQSLLTRKAYELSNIALEYLLREEGLYYEWFYMLKGLVKECLETIQPNISYNDPLDINKFIKVKKILFKDQSLTQLIKGVVIRKNIANKRMSNSLSNPSVLMIKGDFDQSSGRLFYTRQFLY